MLTLKSVNKEIHKTYPNVDLVQGEGYFYIIGTNEEWKSKIGMLCEVSIYCYRLNHQPIDRWIFDVDYLIKQAR